MSAFILSDKHISTIARHFAPSDELTQAFANKLKRINIESVNYRYSHHGKPTRVTRCKLQAVPQGYTLDDFAQLAHCWIYQACEKPSIDFEVNRRYLELLIKQQRANPNNSKLWAV